MFLSLNMALAVFAQTFALFELLPLTALPLWLVTPLHWQDCT